MSILSEQSVMWFATDSSQNPPLKGSQVIPQVPTLSANQPANQRRPADLISPDLPLPDLPSIERQQQSLSLLSQHPALYSGDLVAAAAIITSTAAVALSADRVSLWLWRSDKFERIDSYERAQDRHKNGQVLATADYAIYFESLSDRPNLIIENVAESVSIISCFTQQNLIFHNPGAFLEVPVRSEGKVVGALWWEYSAAHRWTALETAAALSIAILSATAIEFQHKQALSLSLDKYRRQLKRETIEREQAEQAWQESQRFIQGIIDASTNILYVDSFADGSNFYMNRWIQNVLGYEPEDIKKLGKQYLEQLVHPNEKEYMTAERTKLTTINDGEVVENEYR
ncbi:MAG: hypothetical protein DCF15_16070, partial [Phormidesmis priestleyi]